MYSGSSSIVVIIPNIEAFDISIVGERHLDGVEQILTVGQL